MKQQQRKVGRPRRMTPAPKREFFMLEKNDKATALMKMAHAQYRRHVDPKDTSDAEIIRWALRMTVSQVATEGDSNG